MSNPRFFRQLAKRIQPDSRHRSPGFDNSWREIWPNDRDCGNFASDRAMEIAQTTSGSLNPSSDQPGPLVPGFGRAGFSRAGLGRAAMAWYLSALIHLAGYVAAVGIFYFLGMNLIEAPYEHVAALAASLADEQVEADAAKLELVPELRIANKPDQPRSGQVASVLTISDSAWIDSFLSDAIQSLASTENAEDKNGGASAFHFRMPAGGLAVTKGSFTAWTEPANPKPFENYLIIIEIRLPDGIRSFRLNDLSGDVRGTDEYRQRIPYDAGAPMASAVSTADGLKRIRSSDQVDVVANKVQLVIKVPGAGRKLVRDTIRIRSRRLREEQELSLVFGQTVNPEKGSPAEETP